MVLPYLVIPRPVLPYPILGYARFRDFAALSLTDTRTFSSDSDVNLRPLVPRTTDDALLTTDPTGDIAIGSVSPTGLTTEPDIISRATTSIIPTRTNAAASSKSIDPISCIAMIVDPSRTGTHTTARMDPPEIDLVALPSATTNIDPTSGIIASSPIPRLPEDVPIQTLTITSEINASSSSWRIYLDANDIMTMDALPLKRRKDITKSVNCIAHQMDLAQTIAYARMLEARHKKKR